MIIVVNMTTGNDEDSVVSSLINEGSFANIGANIEKNPKLKD